MVGRRPNYTGWRFECPECGSVTTRPKATSNEYWCEWCHTSLQDLYDKKNEEKVTVDQQVGKGNPNADRDRAKDGLRNGNEIY